MLIRKLIRQTAITLTQILPNLGLALPRARRFIILDPFLLNAVGHNLNFALAFKDVLERKGWTVTTLANRYATGEVLAIAKARRFFSLPRYGTYSPFFELFCEKNGDIYRNLRLLDLASILPDNVLLVHTVTTFELFGIARWYEELPENRRPFLIIYFQFAPSFELGDREDEIRLASEAYQSAYATLSRYRKVVLGTSSRRIADLFDTASAGPVLVPLPIVWPEPPRPRPDDGRIVIGYLGGPRREKGFHLLPDAIASVLHAVPNVDFLIQCPFRPNYSAEISRLRDMGSRVKVRNWQTASREDYYASFQDIDVVLNAYDPAKYVYSTSMIALEAIGMGKALITTSGTWAEGVARDVDAAGTVMRDFSAGALTEAMVSLAHDWPNTISKAAAAQRKIRETHNVDGFLAATGIPVFARPT